VLGYLCLCTRPQPCLCPCLCPCPCSCSGPYLVFTSIPCVYVKCPCLYPCPYPSPCPYPYSHRHKHEYKHNHDHEYGPGHRHRQRHGHGQQYAFGYGENMHNIFSGAKERRELQKHLISCSPHSQFHYFLVPFLSSGWFKEINQEINKRFFFYKIQCGKMLE
jgi:hypothetical protein